MPNPAKVVVVVVTALEVVVVAVEPDDVEVVAVEPEDVRWRRSLTTLKMRKQT